MKLALVQQLQNIILVARPGLHDVVARVPTISEGLAAAADAALAFSRTKSEQILLALLGHQLRQNTRVVALEFSSGGVGGLNY